jgi:hypothetical protein
MITLKDISNAIITQVTNGLVGTLYSAISFAMTDIKEKVTRPSFFLEFDSNKAGRFNAVCKERTLSAKIYYFASDISVYKEEIIAVQGYLEDIFLEYLAVNDSFIIDIAELDFTVNGGALICTMELYTIEDISDEPFPGTVQSTANDNTEDMEELDIS